MQTAFSTARGASAPQPLGLLGEDCCRAGAMSAAACRRPLVSKMARGMGTGARSVREASQTGNSAMGSLQCYRKFSANNAWSPDPHMAGNFRLQKAHRNAYRKFSANNAWSPSVCKARRGHLDGAGGFCYCLHDHLLACYDLGWWSGALRCLTHLGARSYFPCCFACHSASTLRMFSSSICLYQSLAPLRSFLWPVTCPRFIPCSFRCVVGG